MEVKTIYTKHDLCTKCKRWTPHHVQHESENDVDGIKTVTYKTSCVICEPKVLGRSKTVHEGIFYLLMSDKLKPPYNQQTL